MSWKDVFPKEDVCYETESGLLYIGNALEKLRELPDESVDCVITSPPYYLLRQYGRNGETVAVWGGAPECEHEWVEEEVRVDMSPSDKSKLCSGRGANPKATLLKGEGSQGFCVKCGAWKGELGHEPDPELFVSHLADIFDEVRRVLKKTGNCFINIGDTYAGGGGTTGGYAQSWEKDASHRPNNRLSQKIVGAGEWIKRKQILLIPYRLAMELQMRGWIIRDMIIWAKKVAVVDKEGEVVEQIGNGLPESASDRLTKSYEVIIHAVKSEKYYFNKPRTSMKPQSAERMMRGMSENHKYAKLPRYGGGGGLNSPRPNVRYAGKFTEADDPEKFGSPRARAMRSKFLNTDMERNGSLAGRVVRNLQRGKEYTFVRKAIKEVNEYLKQKLKESGYSLRELSEITGIKPDALAHYFRTDDTGAALPSREAWEKLKPVLGLGEYEDYIKEEYKSVIPEFDGTAYVGNVLQMNTEPFPDAHFAVMPTKMVRFLLRAGCPEGGTVLDPFMGAGTVALVAEEERRKWIGTEISSEYAEIVKKRLKYVQKKIF